MDTAAAAEASQLAQKVSSDLKGAAVTAQDAVTGVSLHTLPAAEASPAVGSPAVICNLLMVTALSSVCHTITTQNALPAHACTLM